jgi:hypothetical protein
MLTPREIIAHAWAVTTTQPTLKKWGFFGSFFEILLDVKLLVYQIYFLVSYIRGEGGGLFDIEIYLYQALPFWLFATLLTLFILLVTVELFVPSLSSGAIIGLAAKAHRKEKVEGGFILALYNFFPILAVHEVFVFSSLSIFITAISVILRYGAGLQTMLIVVATIVWIVSNIMRFFSSFTESAVVVEKMNVFKAGAKSVKLMMSYMPHVMFLFVLLIVISIRILINTLVIVLVPMAILGSGLLMTYVFQPIVSYTIAGVLGLLLTLVAAYFFAYLQVFKQAVWTIMYMELIKEKELDKIV